MSRLVNPGVGDYLDRLSILELKIQHGQQEGKDVAHFRREYEAIVGLTKAANVSKSQLVTLTVINAQLWQAEDEMRERRAQWRTVLAERTADVGPGAYNLIALAFRIQELNDQRSWQIDEINKANGDDRGQEKL